MHPTFNFFMMALCMVGSTSLLANTTVLMHFTEKTGVSKTAGTITISETKYGLLFTPNLHGLTPMIHGFHIHQYPSCNKDGMEAGGHFDPKNSSKHLGPYNDKGHLGDLPALYVDKEGRVTLPVLAPRIMHLAEIKNYSLMIHEGGDNYSDKPQKLGGGGARMICGIIK